MKRHKKKNLIIVVYWIVIMFLVFYGDEGYMPFLERSLCFLSFTITSIIISLTFSKTLFKHTLANKKRLPFIYKFLLLTLCMGVCHAFIEEVFCILEGNRVFASTHFLDENKVMLIKVVEDLPSTISLNLLFCSILLYYEYSELQNTNLKYQLQILHAQITPHFMFNVLNYIYVLMQKDVDMASALLLKYSDTLRYQLYSGKEDYVQLEKEVQFLKNYIDVEKFRWNDKLDVTCQWDIEDNSKELPPLLLITFVENAFKYVSRSNSTKGFINIKLEQKGQIISFEVENTKSSKTVRKNKNSGIGLENVKTRLDILYGKQRYDLTLKDEEERFYTQLILYI